MRDLWSTTVEGAAFLARLDEDAGCELERPSAQELADDQVLTEAERQAIRDWQAAQ